MATVISSKVDWLNNYYIVYLSAVISAILNAVVIIAVLFTFDWLTALVCGIACVGMLGFPMMFYKIMSVRGNKEWAVQATYYADCVDGTQGVSSLKAFNANDWHRDKIHRQGEILRKAVMSHLKITTVESGVLELFARLGSAAKSALKM